MSDKEKLEKQKKSNESLEKKKVKVAEKNHKDYLNYLDERARGRKNKGEIKKLAKQPLISGFKRSIPV